MRPVFPINSPLRKTNRLYLRNRQTPEELFIWKFLRSKQTGFWFKRQVSIGPYFLDFYCPQKHLAIEIDGNYHKTFKQQEYDTYRSEYLKSLNIKTLRFWNQDIVTNIREVIKQIRLEHQAPSP